MSEAARQRGEPTRPKAANINFPTRLERLSPEIEIGKRNPNHIVFDLVTSLAAATLSAAEASFCLQLRLDVLSPPQSH